MNKKLTLIYIIIVVVFGIAASLIYFLYPSNRKVEGAVNGPYFGPSINCNNNTLEAGQSTICTLTINTDTYRMSSFQGKIASSSNITLSELQLNSNWYTLNASSFDLGLTTLTAFPAGNVNIATFKATANSVGEGYVKLEKINEQLVMGYDDDELGGTVDLAESTKSINVIEHVEPTNDDATLNSIKVNGVEVITDLTINVDNSVTTANIVVEKNDSAATVTGDGQVDLTVGNNSFDRTVVSGDESTTLIYTVLIYREPAEEEHMDTLSSLSISPGNLNETFNPEVNNYTATVPYEVDRITVSASASDINSNLTGDESYPLTVGQNTITVSVTSSTDVLNEYTITVTRMAEEIVPKSNVASVESITVDGVELDLETLTTTIENMNNDYISIEVTPTDSKARVTGEIGSQVVRVGENTYEIIITAEDGTTTNSFTVIVIRKDKEEPVDPSGDKDDKDDKDSKDEQDKKDDKDETTCVLTSDVYNIDNINLKINEVSLNDTSETIEKNLDSTCGTIIVSNEKVILKYGDSTKSYLIERIWFPKTGNERTKYWLIFAIIISLLSIGIAFKLISNKKEKKANK